MSSFVRGRAVVVVLVVAALLGGVTAGSVAAATKTTVTWKVSSLRAGQVKNLSAVATTNSRGVKTWSKRGSCTLTPISKPTRLTMGSTGSCVLTLRIAKSGKYSAKTSTRNIASASSSTTTVAATTTTVPVTTTVAPVVYSVGAAGPGGGIIFYVDMTRAPGSQYFEAACVGWQNNCDGVTADPQAEWGCYGTSISGADGLAIGTGELNTTEILTECSTVGIAADLADDYSHNDLDDWFLPSQDESYQMYIQRTAIGGFSTDYCWSSSEGDGYGAWFQSFGSGGQGTSDKDSTFYVRPVRAF